MLSPAFAACSSSSGAAVLSSSASPAFPACVPCFRVLPGLPCCRLPPRRSDCPYPRATFADGSACLVPPASVLPALVSFGSLPPALHKECGGLCGAKHDKHMCFYGLRNVHFEYIRNIEDLRRFTNIEDLRRFSNIEDLRRFTNIEDLRNLHTLIVDTLRFARDMLRNALR